VSLQCQKIEIKKLPFLASDITNFTSAVCAVVLEMSNVGEPLFTSWADTYSADLFSSYNTVLSFSSNWGTGDGSVDNFVISNSANILDVNSLVNLQSSFWIDTSSYISSVSSELLTFSAANNFYVKLSGDVMSGGLSSPALSTDTLYVGNSTINFFNENGEIFETLRGTDVSDFKSTVNTVYTKSANWENTYNDFNSQSANNISVYNTANSNSATNWNYQGNDLKSLSSNWQNTYNNFSTQSANNISVYSSFNSQSANNSSVYATVNSNSATTWNYQGNDLKSLSSNWQNTYLNVNSNSGNWNYSYYTILTGGSIGGNLTVLGSISATLLEATSANITYIDIKEYELSGFDVKGDVKIEGNTFVEGFLSADSIKFNTNPPLTTQLGEIYWDPEDNTLAIDMGNDVIQQVGFEQYIEIKANGANIDKGTVVWATDAVSTGNSGIIRGANKLANGSTPPRFLIGVATENIISDENGRITTFGVIREADLRDYGSISETWSVGDILYPSPTILGGWTKVEPTSPNLVMPIAFILFINNGNTKSNVTMMVRVDNGYNLEEIHNVYISNILNGDSLTYNSSISSWTNSSEIRTLLNSNSANWENTYTTVQSNSATTWNYQGNDVKSLTGNWQDTYNQFSTQSANNISVYSSVNSKSANWDSVYSSFNSQSSNNISVYNTVQSNSSTTWNYQGTDIKSLTGNWEHTYTNFSLQSADNLNITTTVETYSSTWELGGTPQTLSFNESNAELSISNGNTISLSSLSGGSGPSGEPLFTSWAQTYSGNYESTYSTVQSNSSTWGGGSGLTQPQVLTRVFFKV
jgi:gas vesicle protein